MSDSQMPKRLAVPHHWRWPLGLTAGVVVLFVYYYYDKYFQSSIPSGMHQWMLEWLPITGVCTALVYVIAALGLNMVVGYAGLLDLGFVAFWALGGYTMGWLASDHFDHVNIHFLGSNFARNLVGVHISVYVVVVAAAIICAIGGVIIGAPTLRLKSDYLALVTLGFGEIIGEVAVNGDNMFGVNITGGARDISPVDYAQFLNFDDHGKAGWGDVLPLDRLPKFLLFSIMAAIVLFASLRIREGRLGRAWLAIREDELAASLMGVPLMRTKLSAYALGAVAGGVAGVAGAINVGGVFSSQFSFAISINLLAMVVLGGMGNVWGVSIGAFLLTMTNLTWLPKQQLEIEASEATGTTYAVVFLLIGVALAAAGVLLWARRRTGLLFVYLAAPLLVIGTIIATGKKSVSYQFLIFGAVLIIMMLFRREGLIPEARTRLILREPGRTELEALGADLEDEAPELESLPDERVHAHHRGGPPLDGPPSVGPSIGTQRDGSAS